MVDVESPVDVDGPHVVHDLVHLHHLQADVYQQHGPPSHLEAIRNIPHQHIIKGRVQCTFPLQFLCRSRSCKTN